MKVVKNNSFFSRYQVKFKRRRKGKTDYKARHSLCNQDKNKYNCPKYRLVVRLTNRDIVCQIMYASLNGDVCVCAAYAHELRKYGLKLGLTNYAAAYCVGLLLARRILKKFKLDKTYVGVEEPDGEDYNVEEAEGESSPFYCILDTGLARTSTGAKVFAALKGALDGGLDIPHSDKRFVGYQKEEKSFNAEVLRKYIFGGHVSEYMQLLKDENPEAYQKLFSRYIAAGIEPEDMEEIYKKTHEAIRDDPSLEKKNRVKPAEKQLWKQKKATYDERKIRLKERLASLMDVEDE